MTDDTLWQTKLHARLHDPAEKALVLLRDPAGHEGGTSRALHRDLGFHNLPVAEWLDPDNAEVLDGVLFQKGIPVTMYRDVKRADWWAAGADRPQWPMEEITVTTKAGEQKTLKVADWAQVRWSKRPVLIHPLTGKEFDLGSLGDTDIQDIKERSFDHFSRHIVRDGGEVDWRRTLLAFWRFGPELREEEENGKLGHLWPLLPADTRVPDHTVWDHLDLTSAFAGAFAADAEKEAALLAVSLGPVQGFIAAARSLSDLWAGSHLLARLSWEAMKVVCERLGPDAILFPCLRGVPQVDVWLRDHMGLPGEWFEGLAWTEKASDANPLFAAALPNRFVAVVPASQAREIAAEVAERVRAWLLATGLEVVDRLLATAGLRKAGERRNESVHAYTQVRRQLEGFPEVYWAAVPFSLIRPRDGARQTDLDVSALLGAMAPFFGGEAGESCGFLATPAWEALQREIDWGDSTAFYAPKPGVLYPAVYDLAERILVAAKSVRPFSQSDERGWRDSLTGEVEWLTHDPAPLGLPPGQRTDTLWDRVARQRPAWAKRGEHLGGLSAIKRLWPTLFAEEVARATGGERQQAARFVVSTHTMALARQLDAWLDAGTPMSDALRRELESVDPVALPRRLARRHGGKAGFRWAGRLPALLDAVREAEPEDSGGRRGRIESLVKSAFKEAEERGEGEPGIEAYYALLLFDGDRMGRILSGDPDYAIPYRGSFHPQVRQGFDERARRQAMLGRYGAQRRALSPGRHLAISGALNDFALHVVPEIVEGEYLGRVIYAGGDDLLAMLPVAEVLEVMRRLRCAYSGHDSEQEGIDWRQARRSKRLVCKDGFVLLDGRLMRMMGEGATASCGVAIAHHQAPLGAVRRELAGAEQRAKNEGGRDAFSVALIKRSGGATHFTAKWGEPLDLLVAFRDFLSEPKVSRRAVYNSLEWLKELPADAGAEMVGELLAYQLRRQTASKTAFDHHDVPGLARRLAARAAGESDGRGWLRRMLTTAEFLARETRTPPTGKVESGREKVA
jgi:CRISPR-associated protein Cmr2